MGRACIHSQTEVYTRKGLLLEAHATCSLQHKIPLNKKQATLYRPKATHTSTFQPKMMKYKVEHYRSEWQSARYCAAPLSHCLLLPEREKKRGGGNRGKETVNSEKQVGHIEISLFFIIYYWDFSVWKLQEIPTAFDSSTCGLGIHAGLSYVWVLATRQTTTYVNNILD